MGVPSLIVSAEEFSVLREVFDELVHAGHRG